jgi:CDP-6-deoxy-D-xylo-4-hexulose-3-dehydrase
MAGAASGIRRSRGVWSQLRPKFAKIVESSLGASVASLPRVTTKKVAELRQEILQLVDAYCGAAFPEQPFLPGATAVPVSGRVFDAREVQALVSSALDFWLTAGPYAATFEREFARRFGVRSALLVNSGSSANLLALSCLTSPSLGADRLLPGDEVLTVACGFPTTVNPIVQNQLVPVFVDVELPTYNVNVSELEAAVGPKTRAIMIAHTLGNPFNLEAVTRLARKHDLYLIEDCCDAVGATYEGVSVGTFGDLATTSFYPAHHITMGEGGAVLVDSPKLKRLVESFRDWGRDCWCDPGKDNTCGKRFDWQLGDLPCGYDHKYTYSHIGYNLKATDLQAAIGVAQLGKLDGFIAARRQNFARLHAELSELEEFFILPQATPCSQPSWFGFPLSVRADAPFSRDELTRWLDARRVATRLMFGGNLLRQPAYEGVARRQIGELGVSDFIAKSSFWLGVFPGLSPSMLSYSLEAIHGFVKERSSRGRAEAPLKLAVGGGE